MTPENCGAGPAASFGWEPLILQTLWLDEDLRRGGLGAKIVRAVEDEGKQRGAHAVLLYTYDFQARYCIGSFEFPDGVTRFYMCRTL